MDTIVAGYRTQLMGVAQNRHWTLQDDGVTDARDARLIMRQGAFTCPVLLYHTGKIVVQGKASPFRDTLVELCRQLEAGDTLNDDTRLLDTEQAIAELAHLPELLPSIDPLAARLAAEATLTYQHQACLATAFLLGASSERMILLLIEAFAHVLSPEDQAQYQRRLHKDPKLSKQWEVFHTAWHQSPLRKETSHDLDTEITQTFQFTRICRNESGHPQLPAHFDCDLLRANLAYFRRYLTVIQGLIDLCQSRA
ncbi:MAG: hypothetical protein C7B46_20475 [Sulfobacillus benefaciens]|uniref:Uncharacterized protein n=1 Tax=Sulfobacillus benefaciens TaxID=453960 RepID=A0A2T2WUH7_9FIRM|nr:MAG: hypothetical protein C7B46_20475 [Sulfobacillus benefaciens]